MYMSITSIVYDQLTDGSFLYKFQFFQWYVFAFFFFNFGYFNYIITTYTSYDAAIHI